MTLTKKAPGGAGTFLRFAWQQLRERKNIAATFAQEPVAPRAAALSYVPNAPRLTELTVGANDSGWRPTGVMLRSGQIFSVLANGVVWISKPLQVGATPVTALWLRVGGKAPLRKMLEPTSVFEAWAEGELELCLKPPGEWLSENGDFDPAVPRVGTTGSVDVAVAVWDDAGDADEAASEIARERRTTPKGWNYLWRIGDGNVYADEHVGGKPCIHVHTHGDVGILQYPAEAPLDASATLEWRWCIDKLPSALPEHIQPTHDYLSIAVEFDNGQDLTYFWSSELPVDTVFKCPLPWWDKRETHWVVRSGREGLGQWQSEKRSLKSDYEQAIGGELPARIVRVWLIANSVFQRRCGEAKFAEIALSASGQRQKIV